MWILTNEYNDYDQHGEYFVDAWLEKPSSLILQELNIMPTYRIDHVLSGGGRIDEEYEWFYLRSHSG